MLAEARRQKLLDGIAQQGFATLEDLVALSGGASESTVRRDLDLLDQKGAIKRTHGGAVFLGGSHTLPALDDRVTSAAEEKRKIGKATAALVRDGDTVLLDGGTTTLEVARALIGRPVQIVTNSLPIASLVSSRGETDLILIGGYVYPRTGVAMGPMAISAMQGLRVRLVIMGAGGIVADGIYNHNNVLVETERAMMACGQEMIVVADSTKFGAVSLARLCSLEQVSRFVVDNGVPQEFRDLLNSRGVPFTLANDDATAPTTRNGS